MYKRTATFILLLTFVQAPRPAQAVIFERFVGACQSALMSLRKASPLKSGPTPPAVAMEFPKPRRGAFATLDDVMRAFSRGLVPDLNDKDQADAFYTYLITWFGQSSQRKPSVEKFQRLLEIQKRHPELMGQLRFRNQLLKISNAPPMPVPHELRAATDRLLRTAKVNSAKLLKFEANIGVYRRLLNRTEGTSEDLLPAVLRATINNEKAPAQEKHFALFNFLRSEREKMEKAGQNVRSISQAMVDLVHNAGFLDSALMNRLQSEFSAVRLGALTEAIQRRDSFAMELGFASHFQQILEDYKIPSPNGVERPKEMQILITHLQSVLFEQELDSEDTQEKVLRHLSVLEQPFRSCVGGSDCSSDTYFDFAMEPATHYFTMTDAGGISSGHMTIVLGTVEGVEGKAAFVDKIQNVPPSAVLPMLEGVRRAIAEHGYTLYVSKDAGNQVNGISNDFQTADAFNAIVQKIPGQVLRGFKPLASRYNFDHLYSRAFRPDSDIVAFAPQTQLQIQSLEVDHPWSTGKINFRELVTETLKLKDGSWAERLKYYRLIPLLKSLNLIEDEETKALVKTWMADSSMPVRMVLEVVQSSRFENYVAEKEVYLTLSSRPWEQRQKILAGLRTGRIILSNAFAILLAADQPSLVAEFVSFYSVQMMDSNLIDLNKLTLNPEVKLASSLAMIEKFKKYPARIYEVIEASVRAGDYNLHRAVQKDLLSDRWEPRDLEQAIVEIAIADGNLHYALNLKNGFHGGTKDKIQARIEADPVTGPMWLAKLESDSRPHTCFIKGTLIDTPKGSLPIEALKPGDPIWSYNPGTREVLIDHVEARVDGTELRTVSKLNFNDGRAFTTTAEHPVYSISRQRFVPADELELGEAVLVLRNGKLRPSKLASRTVLPVKVPVFNFHTRKQHNYFSNGVLVHNIKITM